MPRARIYARLKGGTQSPLSVSGTRGQWASHAHSAMTSIVSSCSSLAPAEVEGLTGGSGGSSLQGSLASATALPKVASPILDSGAHASDVGGGAEDFPCPTEQGSSTCGAAPCPGIATAPPSSSSESENVIMLSDRPMACTRARRKEVVGPAPTAALCSPGPPSEPV